MREDQLEKGMVVRLKSGGPPMTVRVVSGSQAYCEWFTELDRRQGTFEIASLEVMSDSPPEANEADQAPPPQS